MAIFVIIEKSLWQLCRQGDIQDMIIIQATNGDFFNEGVDSQGWEEEFKKHSGGEIKRYRLVLKLIASLQIGGLG